MPEAILGISAYYHDSAAALIVDGEIVAAAQEERFSRKKHDPTFPANAVNYVLEEAGLQLTDITAVAFYDKPYIKFERLLETYHGFAPKGLNSFLSSIPVWIKEKLLTRHNLKNEFDAIGGYCPPLIFPEHHLSHASSAFFPSPFPLVP
jgi:carbamoyltransferase